MDILATARERLVLARNLGPSGIRETVRREGVERIGRGTYLKTDPTWESWERARVVNLARTIAALECGTDARACLTSAAVLWDLPIWQFPTTVDILIGRKGWRKSVDLPTTSGLKNPGTEQLRRHGYAVEESDHAHVSDVPTLSLMRLALDISLQWHPRDALVTVDSILRRLAEPNRADRGGSDARAATVRAELSERLEAMGPQRGTRKARAVIATASPWSESPGESVTRWAALALGLPEPVCQHEFTRSDGRHFYLDLFWELFKLGIEFDGLVKYRGEHGADVVVAEKVRDDEIRRSGISLVHLDSATARSTSALKSTLRGALPEAAWRQAQPRSGLWTPDLAGWRTGR